MARPSRKNDAETIGVELKDYGRLQSASRIVTSMCIRYGKIKRKDACSMCGEPGETIAHHTDYFNPLVVEFLCRKCHSAVHHGNSIIGGDWGGI